MSDDAELLLETPICCLLPIPHEHAPLEPFVKITFHRFGKVGASYKESRWRRSAERDTRLFDVHLTCAVSPVCVFLTNALWSHYACGLECGGSMKVRCKPHYGRLLLF